MKNFSRRQFLNYNFRGAVALGGAAAFGNMGALTARAAGNSNYRALVCVFLFGGNDGHNTLIPLATQSQGYTQYAAARQTMALAQAQLLPIAGPDGTYGLHPRLTSTQSLYMQGKAALVANVGCLVVPTTRAQYLANNVLLPDSLFSHSNQTNQWQTARPNDFATSGWAGRAADAMQSFNAPSTYPMIVNTAAGGLFGNGAQTQPTTVPPGGPLTLNSSSLTGRTTAFQQLLSFDNGLQLVQASNQITTRGAGDSALLKAALSSAPAIQTVFPSSQLGQQLKLVAQIIAARGSLAMNRQIFFVSAGGFDTHSNQLPQHDALLQDVDQSIGAFYNSSLELGVDQCVTTFTHSEFGRTLQPSSGGGTDHAWGSHHVIVGGAVKGGLYGTFPTLALGGPDDANSRGTLIPTTSVEQYGSVLASWFGLPAAYQPQVFPTLGNFPAPSLGFL